MSLQYINGFNLDSDLVKNFWSTTLFYQNMAGRQEEIIQSKVCKLQNQLFVCLSVCHTLFENMNIITRFSPLEPRNFWDQISYGNSQRNSPNKGFNPLTGTGNYSTATSNNEVGMAVNEWAEEVMVQLLKQKCLPILLYALDVCNLDKRSMQSLDFTFNRFFMKLFKTSHMEIVNCCQKLFGCDLPSTLLKQRFEKFIATLWHYVFLLHLVKFIS